MQRYLQHAPAAGEVVIFDRSWYNRAGVEHVMGFCSKEQHRRFLEVCPEFEKYVVDDGILLVKFWLEVSEAVRDDEVLTPRIRRNRDTTRGTQCAQDQFFRPHQGGGHEAPEHQPWPNPQRPWPASPPTRPSRWPG
jgi:hypothetical protein